MLLGNGGVPLSYMICDDTLRLDIDPATTSRLVKLYWNAKFTGPSFHQDQVRVWGYLAHCVITTPGLNVIRTYQSVTTACQAWLDLQTLCAGPAKSRKKMIVACVALKILRYKSEKTFAFSSYAS